MAKKRTKQAPALKREIVDTGIGANLRVRDEQDNVVFEFNIDLLSDFENCDIVAICAETMAAGQSIASTLALCTLKALEGGNANGAALFAYRLGLVTQRNRQLPYEPDAKRGKLLRPGQRRDKRSITEKQLRFVVECYRKYIDAGETKNRASVKTKEALQKHHGVSLSAKQIGRICEVRR